MADFCSLCGYGDINIDEIYEEYIRPALTEENIAKLTDGVGMNMGIGICESCGLMAIGVIKDLIVMGHYYNEKSKVIGWIDKDTHEFHVSEEILAKQAKNEMFQIEMERVSDEYRKDLAKMNDDDSVLDTDIDEGLEKFDLD